MSQYPKRIFVAAFAAFIAFVGPTATEAQQAAPNPRIALVVGNATYRDAALATTANDAGLVAQTLQSAGFDVVGARDLDGQSLRTALRDFLQKAQAAGPDMQAFVYLSGRGVQYNGDNYFVPVDAQINRDADVPIEAVRIADFTHALAATPGQARIIVLDAARANPYAAQGSPLAPGLALVDPEPGELIAFNAAPGTLAGDEEGPYGVYGKTLAGAIRQGGVDIAQAFDQTRVSVNAETQGALLPWSASKLGGPFYVFERAADAPPAAPPLAQTERRPISSFSAEDAYAAAIERDTLSGYREFLAAYPNSDQARRVRAILAVRREASYWRHTVRADTPRAYWTYLHTYPKGPHVADAERRLTMLSAEFQPPPDFRPETYAGLPPPPPDERFYEEQPIYAFDDFGPPPPPPPVEYVYSEDDDWRDLPPPPPPPEVGVLPVLGVALPIAVGAVAYQGLFHRDGIAPRGAPRFRQPAPAPPPLPANIKPVAPPAPVAVAAPPVAHAAIVKPLPPIGRRGQPGALQPSTPAAPANPAGAATPTAPNAEQKPRPTPNAGNSPAAPLPAQATKPPQGAATPGANAPAIHAVPGGKPLPAPVAPPAAAAAPTAPGGKPLPTPVAPPAAAVAPPVPTPPGGKPLPTAPGGKPLPTPGAPPAAAAAPAAPTAPGGKAATPSANVGKPAPLPAAAPAAATAPIAPGGKPAPAAAVPPAATKAIAPPVQAPKPTPPTAAINPAPKPNVASQPPAAALRAAAPPGPAARAPAPAALAPSAPRPAPTAIRVPAAAPAPHPAPPAVHVAPPPVAVAPPVVHAPPPVVHAPPPPAVAAPALRQPPPAVRVQPQAPRPPACGRPGLPPCPK